MSDRAYARTQREQKTLVKSLPKNSILQRRCACDQHTIIGGECSTCRSEQSMLGRSQRAFGPPSVSTLARGNASPVISNSGEASRFGHDFSQIPVFAQHKETLPTASQNQFKTWGSAGGLSGLTLDVTFSVSDTPATSLQAIQTVMCTGGPRRVGTYSWKMGTQTWDAFVDGGKYSPYVTIQGNPPAHPTKPYYLTAAEVASQVKFANKAGTIQIKDNPGAAALWDEVHFETAIIAVDGRGADKDKTLNAFKWGWTGKGTKPDIGKGTTIAGKSSGISVIGRSVTPEFRNIVKHDYPNYDIG